MITIADIRTYLLDQTASDNQVLQTLAFSDEQIETAMKTAAREFHSIPPDSIRVQASSLPDDTNLFFDGISAALLRSEIARLARNDIDYSGGSVHVNTTGKRLEHFKVLEQHHQSRFERATVQLKKVRNIRNAMGQIG